MVRKGNAHERLIAAMASWPVAPFLVVTLLLLPKSFDGTLHDDRRTDARGDKTSKKQLSFVGNDVVGESLILYVVVLSAFRLCLFCLRCTSCAILLTTDKNVSRAFSEGLGPLLVLVVGSKNTI